jgi:hypothetical protein
MERYSSPELQQVFKDRLVEFGEYSGIVLDYLADPTYDQPPVANDKPFHREDFHVLGDYLHQLEQVGAILHDPLIAADDSCVLLEQYEKYWFRFQSTLPLNEAERSWLWHADYDPKSTDSESTLARKLGRQQASIVVAGIHRAVTGQELLNRWLDWRHEAGAYQDQDTLAVAKKALRELVELVP